MNFSELPENTLLGWRLNPQVKLSVLDENDREVGDEFICCEEKKIRLKRAVAPSNFTTNEKIIHQDCLGYLMQRFAVP